MTAAASCSSVLDALHSWPVALVVVALIAAVAFVAGKIVDNL